MVHSGQQCTIHPLIITLLFPYLCEHEYVLCVCCVSIMYVVVHVLVNYVVCIL